MRMFLTILIATTLLSTRAQSQYLPGSGGYPGGYGYTQWRPYKSSGGFDSSRQSQKWQLRSFASISAGYIFFNGGISYISAPIGLALIRPLNNNLSAFGAVTAAPTFFSINHLYNDPHNNNFSTPYGLGLNARVEGGLIYTNDAKTFSISGSVGIERGGYPVYPTNNRPAAKRQ